jgi:hypothetical protein
MLLGPLGLFQRLAPRALALHQCRDLEILRRYEQDEYVGTLLRW